MDIAVVLIAGLFAVGNVWGHCVIDQDSLQIDCDHEHGDDPTTPTLATTPPQIKDAASDAVDAAGEMAADAADAAGEMASDAVEAAAEAGEAENASD